MSTTEINLWLDSHRMEALEEVMEAEDTSVEKYMQNYLIELYTEMVPLEEQQRVDRIIAAERQAEALAAEAQRKFCVYMITENGQRTFLSVEGRTDLLQAALLVNRCLKEDGDLHSFQKRLTACTEIKEHQFYQAGMEYLERPGRVTGVYGLDVDKGIFSSTDFVDGLLEFSVKDLSTAAGKAFRKNICPLHERRTRFYDSLAGKELNGRELCPMTFGEKKLDISKIIFEDEVIADKDLVNFYVPLTFSSQKVFGLPCADGTTINVYANYDVAQRQTSKALDVVVSRGDAEGRCYRYPLSNAERELLAEKMDDYCRQQHGESLEQMCRECELEQIETQPGPEMQPM